MEQEILLAAADYEIYDPYEKRYHHLFDLEAFNLTLNLTESSDRGTLMGGAQDNPFSSASFICSIAMIVVACTGTIANSITAYVFSRPTMTSSISILLSGLALVDACVLLTAGPIFAANALFTYWQTFTLMNFVSYSTVSMDEGFERTTIGNRPYCHRPSVGRINSQPSDLSGVPLPAGKHFPNGFGMDLDFDQQREICRRISATSS